MRVLCPPSSRNVYERLRQIDQMSPRDEAAAHNPESSINSQVAPNRDSFQTLLSNDTATHYPRQEVGSEWVAQNMLEATALKENQEALKHAENFIHEVTFPRRNGS